MKELIASVATGGGQFEAVSQDLAREFSRAHVGASTDGAFFIFELSCYDPHKLFYSLIKYDYRGAIEHTMLNGKQTLRQIIQAFVTDRRAVQKSCLVRIVNGVPEELVSAFDRMGKQPDLTDYFRKYLDVRRERSDEELTRGVDSTLRRIFTDLRDILPDGNVPAALERGKASLRGRPSIDESAIYDAAFVGGGSPSDEKIAQKIEKTASRLLKTNRLEGVVFAPVSKILEQRPRKKIKTIESVELNYPSEEEGKSVVKERKPDGDGWTITIRTNGEINESLAERSR